MQEKAKYDILSLNVRGIRDQAKRRSIFLYLKDHNSKIYFLQETYSQPEDEIIWKNEWGGEIFFSHGSRHSKGVCILLHPTVQNKIDYSFSDKAGRIVLITCVLNSLKLSLVNIYAPNSQSEQLDFLQNLNNCLIDKSEISTLIVGGDWNCTLSKIDKIGGTIWKPTNYRNLILTTMDAFDLVDIQRLRHPRLRKYSYESKVLKLKSRIDFFLVAKNLTQHVKKSEIYPSIAPDHRAIYISLSWTTEKSRGPGLWKFNNSLLKDEHYVSKIRETYSRTRAFYSNLADARLLWEMLKMETRAATIAYSKKKAKATTNRELEIRRQLEILDRNICDNFNSPNIAHILNEYEDLKMELQSIYEEKGRAAIFRSKCRWVEKGERPTKYFFNLEKRNYNRKTITELRTESETVTNNESQILEAIENYYSELYASANNSQENNVDEFTEHLKIPKLSDADRDRIEGPLSYEECKKALDTFQNNKAPGEDGFTVEFYMFFFDLLGHDLVASFNAAYDANELTISQRRGVISLIPKEDGSLLELSNWRPVTLLNVDCKIATKAIARRIEPLLPNLVHTDQTGFIKGRYIGENIRLIIDIMEHTKSESIPGILVSLDFRKAFDSLEWSFMMKALDIFNFGTSIKRWISTFYTKIESAAINNGFMTNWFRPSRGVRQGCPLSPYLFVLSTEILSSKIRQEPSITGIKIFGHEIKLSQFADDTNLFCADLISVENALKTVRDFGRLAGLKLNIKKSKAIWLGKWEKNKSYPLQLKWLHSPVRLLGIHVSYDEKGNNELNFNLKIRKLQTKLDMWRSRDLTLFGKVLIIKSLGLSQLIYSASILNVPEDIASTVKTKLFSFLWKNKRDKIKRTGLYQDLGRGGIRMVDIDIMFKALKLAWIPRLLTSGNQNWKTVPDYYLRKFGGLNFLLRCNYDAKYIKSIPLFYRNILVYFSELKTLYSFDQAQNIILFNNKEILVDSKTFFIREWFKKGILSIQDLLHNTGQPMTYQEFTNKYSCKTNFLQYYQVISAIPKHLLAKAKSTKPINKELYSDNNLSLQLIESITLYLNKIKTSDFYTLLCTKIHTTGHSGPQRWSKDLSLDEDKWEKIFTSLKTVCRETKLKEFQYKLIHRIVVTKKELYRYGIKEDDECIYCGEKDSINHTFRDCHFVKIFIQRVINWFNIENKINFNPSSEERLFGILSDLHEKVLVRKFNYTMLFMRYYIYANKLHNKPILLQDFVGKMIIKYRIEKL